MTQLIDQTGKSGKALVSGMMELAEPHQQVWTPDRRDTGNHRRTTACIGIQKKYIDSMRKELRDSWELENPELAGHELAPDLAWLLSSGGADPATLVEALAREYYAGTYQLALHALTYPEEAQRIADETILTAVVQASRYSADQDVGNWLAELARPRIERRRTDLARLDCLNPRLAQAFLQRWPPRPISGQVLDQIVQRLARRLGEKGPWGARPARIKETLLAASGVALALFLLWGSVGWLDKVSSRSPSQIQEDYRMEELALAQPSGPVPATPATPERHDSGVLEGGAGRQNGDTIRELAFPDQPSPEGINSSYSAARLAALKLPALSLFSTHEDVWRRMLFSRYLWKTMWADVSIILYGPAGYLGPARGRRYQVWLDQVQGRVREISGPLDGNPDQQEFLVGRTEENRIRNLRGIDDYARLGSQIPWFYLNGEETLVSPFLRSIYFFAHHDWPPTHERFAVSGEASWKGRPVVIVDQFDRRGRREARFWMDRQLGIAYREQYFSGRDHETVLLEVYVLNFEFDSAFPEGLLDEAGRAELPPAFARNAAGEIEQASPGMQEFLYAPPRGQPRRNWTPPTDLDLGRSLLTFVPPQGMPPQPSRLTGSQLFADGYFLGELPLGDLYTTLCTRSADGMQIAFAPQKSTKDPLPTLHWFRLDDLELSAVRFPEAVISAFEFAPDNRRLAVATIQNRGRRSEIFIIDTDTGMRTRLALIAPVWGLAWRPDGNRLAALEAPQRSMSSEYLVQIRIIDLETGQFRAAQTRTDLNWGASQVLIPLTEWNARFEFRMGGIEACS